MLKKLLFSALVLWFLFAFSLPLPTVAAEGQLIIINKASNELAYYENNKLNRIFSVATGKSPSLTPEGNFIIVNKIINRPYYKDGIPGGDPSNPLGDRWLGLDARGTWGTTYAIHGNNNPASIGNYVSLGCIRMYDEEVRWLFEKVEVNTPVIIVTSKNSFDSIAKANDHKVTTTPIGAAPAITATLLRLGSSGEEVTSLQQTLTNLGYAPGEASGNFNESTEKAVREFQADHELTVDGIVGRETKTTLRDLSEKASSTPVNRELNTDTKTGSDNNQAADPAEPLPKKPSNPQTDAEQNIPTNPSNSNPQAPAEAENDSPKIPSSTLDPANQRKQISPEQAKRIQDHLRRLGYFLGVYDIPYGNPRDLKD